MDNQFIKDPQAVLDYVRNWSSWLGTDTIASATVTAQTGITVNNFTNTTTTVTAWLAGGVVDQRYEVTCRIVTASGRIDERAIILIVREK